MKRFSVLFALFLSSFALIGQSFQTIGTTQSVNGVAGNTIEDTVTFANGLSGTDDDISIYTAPVSGASSVTVKVTNPDKKNGLSQSGLMVRESADPGSAFVAIVSNGTRNGRIYARNSTNGAVYTVRQFSLNRKAGHSFRIDVNNGYALCYLKQKGSSSWTFIWFSTFTPTSYISGVTSAGGYDSIPGTDHFFQYKNLTSSPLRLAFDSPGEFIAYPNPVDSHVTVKTPFHTNDVELWTLEGHPLERFQSSGYKHEMDLSEFSPGIYLIKAQAEDGTVLIKKVVKN